MQIELTTNASSRQKYFLSCRCTVKSIVILRGAGGGGVFHFLIYFIKPQIKVKLSICLTKHQVMKVYEGVEVYFQEF
jgi:hypothetical protein